MTDPSPRPPVPIPPGRSVDLPGRGRTWVHEVSGPPNAPTLMLLHGLTATAQLNWFACFSPLGRHYRVVALDQRGHGRGIRVGRRFRLEDCADDAVALADALGVERFVPVGYSMGGPVAQLVWHRHPDRVNGMVLCATSRNWRGNPREQIAFMALGGIGAGFGLLPRPVRRQMVTAVIPTRMDDPPARQWAMSELRRNDPAALFGAAAALGNFTSHRWIGDVDVPAAVVVTTRDRLVPPRRQYKLAEAIPGATVHEVDGDHEVCGFAPQKFVPGLLDACRSVTSRALAPSRR